MIVKEAVNTNAFGVYLVHNHPSGDVIPSKSDVYSTENLIDVLRTIDVSLVDHIIVGKDKYYSFELKKIIS